MRRSRMRIGQVGLLSGVVSGTPPLDRIPESVLVTPAARGARKILRRERMPPAEGGSGRSCEPPPAE